ncbi:ketopantoate reductase family protein [Actinoplanes derwentensis]|uniref:2-dehydropantoate 2-reductase n=1 Tax=Actinoplanes derwentensis TaxID=113562 RepID=A0A1H2D9J6_9ACTN|nr:ketopantoate reductase family protein [Actinoplanes derwentensis]GID81542.1 2-dehydropantoate 2-reductase [Actinoplanes derwentensis]SDT79264.1 ketopantoate reductase [Actinoplanes derwentensis]
MRILFLGAGATGGYFGGRLLQAGRDVTFLIRPTRAAQLAEHGLRITTPDGESVLTPRTITEPDGHYDLVFVAVKSYALEEALTLLVPAVGPRTVVIPLLNGIRHIESLVRRFGVDRAWGGVCMIHATLDDTGGVVQMSALHRLTFGPLTAGPDTDTDTDRLAEVTETLTGAGFDVRASTTIIQDLWDKWVMLATLGAATTLMRGSIGAINKAPGGPEFLHALAAEAVAVAEAAGHPIHGKAAAMLEATIATTEPATSSMYRDLLAGRPVEATAIVGDLVTEATKHQVSVPFLTAAHTGLAIYSQTL